MLDQVMVIASFTHLFFQPQISTFVSGSWPEINSSQKSTEGLSNHVRVMIPLIQRCYSGPQQRLENEIMAEHLLCRCRTMSKAASKVGLCG